MDWFNQVDATYRGELKQLNELNFSRFDAKLEQRTAGLQARITALEAKLDQKLDQRTVELRAQITALDDRMTHLFAQADDRLERAIAGLRAEITKWMFLFAVGTALAVIGIMSRLVG